MSIANLFVPNNYNLYSESLKVFTSDSTYGGYQPLQSSSIYNVKNYGAMGDGVTDDTIAIQTCVNVAMGNSGSGSCTVYFPYGTYLISSPITIKILNVISPANIGTDIHFSDVQLCNLFSDARSTIIASPSFSGTFMVQYIYNTLLSEITPWYSKIYGLQFNGNNVSNLIGIDVQYGFHIIIEHCTFWKLSVGFHKYGYSVFSLLYNVFYCKNKGIFIEVGGDHLILGNDFFLDPTQASAIGIDLGIYSGNTRIISNIFTCERTVANTNLMYAIRLSGDYSATGSEEIRDVVIDSNEFCGVTYGVKGSGKTTNPNIFNCIVSKCHTLPYSTYTAVGLCQLNYCNDISIVDNYINNIKYSNNTSIPIDCLHCSRLSIFNNKCYALSSVFIQFDNVSNSVITNNFAYDVGKTGAGYIGFCGCYNTCANNKFVYNTMIQTLGTYGQYGIYEQVGGTFSQFADNNFYSGVSTPHTLAVGSNSFLRRVEYGSAIPVTGTYNIGDIVYNTTNTNLLWRCSTAGSGGAALFTSVG